MRKKNKEIVTLEELLKKELHQCQEECKMLRIERDAAKATVKNQRYLLDVTEKRIRELEEK